jgi:hypothetical protein
METHLTIKHLAGYLPFGLKILNGWGDIKTLTVFYLNDENNGVFFGIKPILHPLSDLTKEIEVNGEKFVPISELKSQCSYEISNEIDKFIIYKNYGDMPYWVIKKLLEWHFDIYGLIENGLAIDINTLKN